MKILLANPDDLVYLGRVSEEVKYDGKPAMRYRLKLSGSLDAGAINCTEAAFNMAAGIEPMSKVNIVGDYSSDYRSFKVSAVQAVK